MSATDQRSLVPAHVAYDDPSTVLDERTVDLLAKRRRAAVIKGRGWLLRRMLLLDDLVGLVTAFVVAGAIAPSGVGLEPRLEYLMFVASLPIWIVVAKLYGLYENDQRRTDHSSVDDTMNVFHLVTVGTWLFFAASWLTGVLDPNPKKVATFWALAMMFVLLGRSVARAVSKRSPKYLQNAVIVGAGDVGQTIARKLLGHPEYGVNLVGFVDAEPKQRAAGLEHLTILGPPDQLPSLCRLLDIERVIIAFSNEGHADTLDLIRSLKDHYVHVDIVPRLYEVLGAGVGVHSVEGVPLVGMPPFRLSRSSRLLKRGVDFTLSGIALMLLSPLFAVVGALIKLDSPGPIFFRQVRRGAGETTFRVFKFRTMAADADERKAEVAHLNKHAAPGGDARMFKIENDPRVTRVGTWLRRYMLDELPQLINVLKGDMSLVGPRPLILEEDQYVDSWARRRLDLKPGMTGLWQVLGRTGIPFEEMCRLDYVYVTTWSLWNDARILSRTVPLVLRGDGGRY